MKREDLKDLELSDEQVDKIMSLHGKTVNDLNSQITSLKTEKDTLSEQVNQSSKQLEELKESTKDNESLQTKIQELQDANKQLENESSSKLTEAQKGFALELALRDAGAHDVKTVLPLLDQDTIKFENEKLTGLDEQLKNIQENKSFLFQSKEDGKGKPSITTLDNPNPPSNGNGANDPFAEKVAKYQ
ncbi:phage scaffolding protein [Companilactobacillus sp. DQM5]|uniref:phage scaffolding protein n=1 Tax=Companilactobacillus sp. DQM5 TaxID=3463359 RepID=UPI004057D289